MDQALVPCAISPRLPLAGSFRDHFASYLMSQDGSSQVHDRGAFNQLIASGHIIPCDLVDREGRQARFGIELMFDQDGPYLSFMYYQGEFRLDYLPVITAWLVHMSRHWRGQLGLPGNGRLFLHGRRTWLRMIRRFGLVVNGNWIDGNQEAIEYGYIWRKFIRQQ